MRQEIAAVALPPQLERHFRDIMVGHRVVDPVKAAEATDVGHGFDVEHQYGAHKNTFKNK